MNEPVGWPVQGLELCSSASQGPSIASWSPWVCSLLFLVYICLKRNPSPSRWFLSISTSRPNTFPCGDPFAFETGRFPEQFVWACDSLHYDTDSPRLICSSMAATSEGVGYISQPLRTSLRSVQGGARNYKTSPQTPLLELQKSLVFSSLWDSLEPCRKKTNNLYIGLGFSWGPPLCRKKTNKLYIGLSPVRGLYDVERNTFHTRSTHQLPGLWVITPIKTACL